jgi:hypothetical protein
MVTQVGMTLRAVCPFHRGSGKRGNVRVQANELANEQASFAVRADE